MKHWILIAIFAFWGITKANAQVTVSGAVAASNGTFNSLTAAFTAINSQVQTGNNITITLTASSTITASAVLNAGVWSSINIYPTVSGVSITGNLATPLIDLAGADNVTFDGRVNATGTTKDLIISNINTSNTASTSTVRFINDATANTIKYCNVTGASTATTGGIIFFSTTTGTTGNDNNTLEENNITNAGARPVNAIYSAGTSTKENSGITINNNNLYNFLNKGITSYGINFATNSTACTISGNSFYETSPLVQTANASYQLVGIFSGDGFIVSGNYFGGSAPQCVGTFTKTNAFAGSLYGVYIGGGTITANSVQGNVISGISWSDSGSSAIYGIYNTGVANIGTITGNVIGGDNNSIACTTATTGSRINGISSSGGIVANNTISAIEVGNSVTTNATEFCGINIFGSTAALSVINNTIGGPTVASKIRATSPSTSNSQFVCGINSTSSAVVTISGNHIYNMQNATTNSTVGTAGLISGIYCTAGTNTISGNSIHDLTISNANTSITHTASVTGISMSGSSAVNIVAENHIYNLSNTFSSFTGSVRGLYFTGNTGDNKVSGNFIHDLTVASASGANISGIYMSGTGNTTYSNNIVSLGGNTATVLYGIYESGTNTSNNSYLYHNTVCIGGSSTSLSHKSYALYSAVTTNVRNFRNNIFVNTRSTAGGSNLHYAAYFNYAVTTNLTLGYNNYYVNGTGTVLGYYNSLPVAVLPLIDTKDAYSIKSDPQLVNTASANAADYFPANVKIGGANGTGIPTDYLGVTRASTLPAMGALEIAALSPDYPVEVWKAGVKEGGYETLKLAFDALNAGSHFGTLEARINASTVEPATASLNAVTSIPSLHIYPTKPGLSISGTLNAPLVQLNGADNVNIDGRVNGSGATRDLTIVNHNINLTTNVSNLSLTVYLTNDASNDTLSYCNIKGSSWNVIRIKGNNATTPTGNKNNVIDNNNITNANGNRPIHAVYPYGDTNSPLIGDNGLKITNNYIYDVLNPAYISYAINFQFYGNNRIITGNHFYETTNFNPTASVTYGFIYCRSGSGHIISNNYFGGSGPYCSGKLIKTASAVNVMSVITIAEPAEVATISGNTITAFDWSNSNGTSFYCINIPNAAAATPGGGISNNVIGAATGMDAIKVTSLAGNQVFFGINSLATSSMVSVTNNTIGSITIGTPTVTGGFTGINMNVGTAIGNTIGSLTTERSINVMGNAYGIYASSNVTEVSGNTVSNIYNDGPSPNLQGIVLSSIGCNTNVSNNVVTNLESAATAGNPSGVFINCNSTTYYVHTITGNKITNISATNSSFSGELSGLYVKATTNGDVVSRNYIQGLSTSPAATGASIYGIKADANITTSTSRITYANNIVSIGSNSGATLYGIYDYGLTTSTQCNLYHNTVYLGGSSASLTSKSYALYSAASTNVRNYRNNFFINERSTPGGSSLHYAAYFNYAVNSNLTVDYNNYRATGVGKMLGYYNGANVNVLPIVPTKNVYSFTTNPLFANPGGVLPTDYIATNPKIGGVAGTGITTDYTGAIRSVTLPAIGAYEIVAEAPEYPIAVVKTNIVEKTYPNLRFAFTAINSGTHTGDLEIRISSSVTEESTATLNASGTGSANYSAIKMYPTEPEVSIGGSLAAPLIDLAGADNVTIDGRVGATGATKDLIISNTSTSNTAGTSTVRFINDATANTIRYCNLTGASTATAGGIIFFSTTTGTTGNDNNTLENNDITNSGARPVNAIYSAGTSAKENSGITINNNNFYDFLNPGIDSYGINFATNSTACTISGNSFYETSPLVPTGNVGYVFVSIGAGNAFTISGNYFGGSASQCVGTFTKTNAFSNALSCIQVLGSGSVQGNLITGINWANSSNSHFRGIYNNGNSNIGDITSNVIGGDNNSIVYTAGATSGLFYGIWTTYGIAANNKISTIQAGNSSSANATNIHAIYLSGSRTLQVTNNTIGGPTVASKIIATSPSTSNAQIVSGIYSVSTGVVTISGNQTYNMQNATTNSTAGTAGFINGIYCLTGINTISNNSIHDLTISNASTSTADTTSVTGIAMASLGLNTVSGNLIYGLSNTFSSFAGSVVGIYLSGPSNSENNVSGNFISNLNVPSASGASIYGIKHESGSATHSNNIVSLGGNPTVNLYGISEKRTTTSNYSYLYHNTVYIGGSPTSTTYKSYALYSVANAGLVRNIRNNIFVNARSTVGGSNLHFAVYFTDTGGPLTLGYNNYYVTGIGGTLGYFGANKTALPIVPGKDSGSTNSNPSFFNEGGTIATDYKPESGPLSGTSGTGILTDFEGKNRSGSRPSMGAWEVNINSRSALFFSIP